MLKYPRKFTNYSILALACLLATGIIFSFFSPWLAIADSVNHFRLHLSLALGAMTVLVFISQGLGLSIVLLLIAVIAGLSTHPLNPMSLNMEDSPSFKLLQLNMSFRNKRLDKIKRLVYKEKPDAISLQEVNSRTGRIIRMLKKQYPYSIRCTFATVGGVAILSRYPLSSKKAKGCAENRGLAWMRIRTDHAVFTLTTLHLYWPFPYSQSRQIDKLQQVLNELPRPVVLAGDFNAAPWSYAVNRIAKASGTQVVAGLRFSFYMRISKWLPPLGMPIDHVLLPAKYVVLQARVGPKVGSDHQSVIVTFIPN